MKNDVSKGNALEKRVVRCLTKDGYRAERTWRGVLWIPGEGGIRRPINRQVDFFGACDIHAIHPTAPVRLIQVGTTDNRSRKRQKIEENIGPYFLAEGHYIVEVWTWGQWEEKGYGFAVDRYQGGTSWAKDLFFVPSKEAPDHD